MNPVKKWYIVLAGLTQQDAVKLIGSLVHMREQDAAGLQQCEKLGQSVLCQGRQKRVLLPGHLDLKHRFIIIHFAALHSLLRLSHAHASSWWSIDREVFE
jgi:hypothetical protein